MGIIRYREVSLTGMKSGSCSVCGKHAFLKKKFSQTLNPWNKDKAGNPKDASQITEELRKQVMDWKSLPVIHKKCGQLLQSFDGTKQADNDREN